MTIKQYTLVVATSLLFTGNAVAFDDYNYKIDRVEPAKWWANLSAGRGMADHHVKTSHGISSILSFNGAFSDKVYGTLYRHSVSGKNQDEAHDGGMMVGYRWNQAKGFVGISSGLGYSNQYHTYDDYYSRSRAYHKKHEGVVVPVQLQAFWTPFKHVGFGITTHGALGKENYGSVQFGIQAYA